MENSLKVLLNQCWCWCELCNVMKMVISSLFVWTCHFYYFKTWLWQVLCALRKNENLRRMYHFEGRIARRDRYYISRDVSCVVMVIIIEGRNVRRDNCMDRYDPMGPGLRDSGCVSLGQTCIIILDIALHILIISELDIVFCWSCDCLFAKLVIVEHWACYWGYLIFWSVVVENI